uniref:Ig-like domain-containing protein n=1 Tax=Ursus maritimus TaxID=29073 RepID=A0A452UW63_URSMA
MLLSRLLRVLVASVWLGSSIAQKVTQAQPTMLVQEKGAVALECTLSTSDPSYSLLWYKQPSSGVMIFLIRQDSYSSKMPLMVATH